MTTFRARFMTADFIPHVYVRVFVSPRPGATFSALGNLTMRKPDFEAFRNAFKAEFIEERGVGAADEEGAER